MSNYKKNQWFRVTDAQMDSGDFGDRHGKAGGLAFIDGIKPKQENCYSLVSWPSGVGGFWSEAEIAKGATPIEPSDPAIPSKKALDLVDAVANLYYAHSYSL